MAQDVAVDELLDPTPDIEALFRRYDSEFFGGNLRSCVNVRWSSPSMTQCAGTTELLVNQRGVRRATIRLSEPLLKLRPRKDLIDTLLHEMIHAFLMCCASDVNDDRDGHGADFQLWMQQINAAGHHVTIYHSFIDEVNHYRRHHWTCTACASVVRRAQNRGPTFACRCGHGRWIKTSEPDGSGKGNTSGKGKGKAPFSQQGAVSSQSSQRSSFAGPGHRLGGSGTSPGIAAFFKPVEKLDDAAFTSVAQTAHLLSNVSDLPASQLIECPKCFNQFQASVMDAHLACCLEDDGDGDDTMATRGVHEGGSMSHGAGTSRGHHGSEAGDLFQNDWTLGSSGRATEDKNKPPASAPTPGSPAVIVLTSSPDSSPRLSRRRARPTPPRPADPHPAPGDASAQRRRGKLSLSKKKPKHAAHASVPAPAPASATADAGPDTPSDAKSVATPDKQPVSAPNSASSLWRCGRVPELTSSNVFDLDTAAASSAVLFPDAEAPIRRSRPLDDTCTYMPLLPLPGCEDLDPAHAVISGVAASAPSDNPVSVKRRLFDDDELQHGRKRARIYNRPSNGTASASTPGSDAGAGSNGSRAQCPICNRVFAGDVQRKSTQITLRAHIEQCLEETMQVE